VADLRERSLREEGREPPDQNRFGYLRARRRKDPLSRFDREAHAEEVTPPRVEQPLFFRFAQVEPQGKPALRPRAREKAIELPRALEGEEARAQVHRFLGRHVVLHDRRELELLEEAPGRLPIGAAIPEVVESDVEVEVGHDGHELFRKPRSLAVLLEGLSLPLVPHLVCVLQKGLEASILDDELRSALLAYARDSGNVIDAVSHQRQNVRHLCRRNPELVSDSFGIQPLVLHRMDHGDVVAHELQEILVRGDDEHAAAFLNGPPREGSDEIVGFDPWRLENRKTQSGAEPPSVGGLLLQSVGSRRSVRLVGWKLLVTGGAPAGVERHRGEIVRLVGKDLAQHVGEPEHGVGGEPGAGRERGNREERPVKEVVAVEEENRLAAVTCWHGCDILAHARIHEHGSRQGPSSGSSRRLRLHHVRVR
jgi:hypothetical protein